MPYMCYAAAAAARPAKWEKKKKELFEGRKKGKLHKSQSVPRPPPPPPPPNPESPFSYLHTYRLAYTRVQYSFSVAYRYAKLSSMSRERGKVWTGKSFLPFCASLISITAASRSRLRRRHHVRLCVCSIQSGGHSFGETYFYYYYRIAMCKRVLKPRHTQAGRWNAILKISPINPFYSKAGRET